MKKNAFTLAETLITLAIIGVVATMTVPNLIMKSGDLQKANKLAVVHSVMNKGYELAILKNGPIDEWEGLNASGLDDDLIITENSHSGINAFWAVYAKELKNEGKLCTYSDKDCLSYPNQNLTKSVTMPNKRIAIFRFANGAMVTSTWLNSATCLSKSANEGPLKNVCGDLSVDLNGPQGPNRSGVDVFYFYITLNGLFPIGMEGDITRPFERFCTLKSNDMYNGHACAGWLLYNKNMDYLRCDDLSWNGKRTCK